MVGYDKPYLDFDEQLATLKHRGLHVEDDGAALNHLRRIGYYRLSGYSYPLRQLVIEQNADTGTLTHRRAEAFVEGSTFEQVVALYEFDRKLRALMVDALEQIEISVRVAVAHRLGALDPFAHTNPDLVHGNFSKRLNIRGTTDHEEWLARLRKKVEQSSEDFVKHFREKYGEPFPIWVVIELWEFGMLARFFRGMRITDQNHVARKYGLQNGRVLANWLQLLNYIRNIAAHHSRLWNRVLVYRPKLPETGQVPILDHLVAAPDCTNRTYAALCIVAFMLRELGVHESWVEKARELIADLPTAPGIGTKDMGFPDGWMHADLWSTSK